jgi:mono/diheme cytochrome c family protein
MFERAVWITCSVVALGLGACSKSEPAALPPNANPNAPAAPSAPSTNTQPAPPPTVSNDPQDVFKTRCVMCHGETGHGDGPASVALNPKPRNYSDKEWQKTVTDDQIKKTITGGGASVGKSPLMPPQPDLASKPEVLDGLVKIIRAFGA